MNSNASCSLKIFAGVIVITAPLLKAETYSATTAISDWNNASLWNAPQMAGNDFIFEPSAVFYRLTATSQSFDGNSLVLKGDLSAGSFNINQDITFENYGTFTNGAHNTVHTGHWSIVDNGVFLVRRPKSTLDITLGGEGTLWLGDNLTTKSTVALSADSCNEFAGTLVLGVPGEDDVIIGEFLGDVSAPDLTIKIDASNSSGTTEYSQLRLNHTIAVGAVELDGIALDPGVYDFSDFSTQQQQFFIDGGGQLVVSPPDAPTGTLIEVSELSSALEESAS